MDYGLVGGSVYMGSGCFLIGNLYIKDGKISTFSVENLECRKTYDARGKLVLPGFIDPHVHFHLTVGKNTSSDDFYNGSVKAALGGITTFIDFLDPIKTAGEMEQAFERRKKLAKCSVVDYGFHATIAEPIDEAPLILKASISKGMPTIKLFTTYSSSDRRTKDRYIEQLLKHSKAFGTRILIHAENDSMILENKTIKVSEHEWARPALSEVTEVLKLAEMTKHRDGMLYIVHVSAGSTVKALKEQYGELLHKNIILESCPHYLVLDASKYQQEDGWLFTMTPPLRDEKEKQILNKHIEAIDIIATDHCPFEAVLKNRTFTADIPMGVGGVQHSFRLMYQLYGKAIIPKFTEQPAKVHGLYPTKGTLMPGADADIVIFDEKGTYTIQEETSIYHQMPAKGKIETVFSKGSIIVSEDKFLGGQGAYIERRLLN